MPRAAEPRPSRTLDLPQLESWLWESACVIRGPIDAPKFKDYILPLIFLKRLSDVFDDEIRHLAKEFGSEKQALRIAAKDHQLVRFFIPPAARWSGIAERSAAGLGEYLTDAVRAVARAIAAVLRTVQRAKEACEKAIASVRGFNNALVEHLFRYGPVSPIDAASIPLEETDLGPLPLGWKVTELADLVTRIQYGTSRKCDAGPGTPVLRIPNVVEGRIDTSDLKYLDAPRKEAHRYQLSVGDLLFVRSNGVRQNIGRCAVFRGEPKEALFASYLIRARVPFDKVLPEYIRLFTETRTGRESFIGRASGAADGKFNINSQTIRSTVVPLAPLKEQSEIVQAVAAVEGMLAAEQARRAALEALFKSLLHHLMTGKVRLPAEYVQQFEDAPLAAEREPQVAVT